MTTVGIASNIDAIAKFAVSTRTEEIPEAVLLLGRMCVVDWFGVAIGACNDPTAVAVRDAARSIWPNSGRSMVLLGEPVPAAAAALINGTMAHCLDYDDTHIAAVAHLSGATFASAFAVGSGIGAPPERILRALICGFEVGARLGLQDFGSTLNHRGWHSTSILACLAATTAACIVYDLDEDHVRRALGAAATQVGGLTASFGTMAKPFHAGKAALNALIAVELVRSGFQPKLDLIEPDGGLSAVLVQDGSVHIPQVLFDGDWELLKNTFKPYASCLLTHPVVDAARALAESGKNQNVSSIVAYVNPMTPKLAGKTNVQTPLEGKFSTAFCVAMALRGSMLTAKDFNMDNISNKDVVKLAGKVKLVIDEDMPKVASRLVIEYEGGGAVEKKIDFALGNPENPMSFDDMHSKFIGLTKPMLGQDSIELFNELANFSGCELQNIARLTASRAAE